MSQNQLSGAEAFVRMLQLHGVKYIFGLCGDTTLPLYDALYQLDHGMTHILTRDERSAGYMADTYARVSGRVGVCEGPSGGGATYILPGVVEANESSIPILAITSDISVAGRGHRAAAPVARAARRGADQRRRVPAGRLLRLCDAAVRRPREGCIEGSRRGDPGRIRTR